MVIIFSLFLFPESNQWSSGQVDITAATGCHSGQSWQEQSGVWGEDHQRWHGPKGRHLEGSPWWKDPHWRCGHRRAIVLRWVSHHWWKYARCQESWYALSEIFCSKKFFTPINLMWNSLLNPYHMWSVVPSLLFYFCDHFSIDFIIKLSLR